MSGCGDEKYLLSYSGGTSWRASNWKTRKDVKITLRWMREVM
jgi:hypothetical protein